MTPAEQDAYDAERHSEPIAFRDWCFENCRLWIGTNSYAAFKKNADDYQLYRDAFFAAKAEAQLIADVLWKDRYPEEVSDGTE